MAVEGLPITALFAGYLVALCAGVSLILGLTRADTKVMYGDGGKQEMVHKSRAQGNCMEYAPLIILSLAIAEFNQVPSTLLYVLGLALCIARTSHVWQLWSPNTRPIPFRLYGFLATVAGLALLSVINVAYGLSYYRP